MKQGIFKRIFLLYGLFLLLSVLGTELFVTGTVRQNHIDTLRGALEVQASLIGRGVDFRNSAPLDPLCRQLKAVTGARVTLIAHDGRVLGDSDHASATMDNHGTRIEIQQAELTGTGMTLRHSDTLGVDLLYVARKIEAKGGAEGFVRLSVPLGEVDAAVNALRIKIVLAATLILLATGVFAVWQIDRLRRLTVRVRDFAAAVAKGDLDKRLFLSRSGEFDEIANALNEMTASLKESSSAGEEEKRRLAVILRTVPDALLIVDPGGVIRIANAASRISFGEATLPGNRLIEAIRDRGFQALVEKARSGEASASAELTLALPEERTFSVRVALLSFREGEFSGFVVMFHDITLLKRLEQVRQDFVANISHELKTPITSIRGFAETLLDGALEDPENARKFLGSISENSRRINSLVDDLLTISKIELGAIVVRKSAVRFREVCESVAALLEEKAKARGLSFVIAAPESGGELQADKDRLVQILTNLADNAIKFTDKGSVTLGMGEESGRSFFFVADTGIGIPEKHIPRLGERFYRVDTARSRDMGGTGLGLAIVKHLVKAHGWEMKIESAVGKGTRVKIYLN